MGRERGRGGYSVEERERMYIYIYERWDNVSSLLRVQSRISVPGGGEGW